MGAVVGRETDLGSSARMIYHARMLWLAMFAAAVAVAWWLHVNSQARCRDCGSLAVFCTFPFRCAARRQGVVEPPDEDEPAELPPPEEQL